MAKAQEQLSKATLAEQQAGSVAQQVQSQIIQNMPKQAQPAQQQQLDPDMEQWAQKNPWFMGSEPIHREMTSFAMYVDQRLQAQGIDPAKQSEKYY